MIQANEDLADGKTDAFSVDEIIEFVGWLERLNDQFDTSTIQGQRMYKAVLVKMNELFPNLMKYSKEYNDMMGIETPKIELAD